MTLKEIGKIIFSSRNVGIITHTNADGDALGSCFALKYALLKKGIKAKVILDAKVPKSYEFLGYDPEILTDEAFETVVVLDCGDLERVADCINIFKKAGKTVVIDHHKTATGYGDYNYIDEKASATAEIVFELLEKCGTGLDEKIAEAIFVGISTDTGNFTFSNTTAKSLNITAKLVDLGINISYIKRMVFDQIPFNRLKLHAEAILETKLYFGGKFALLALHKSLIQKYGATEEDSEGLIVYARNIEGVEIAVLIKEFSDNAVKLSLRSNSYVDVSRLAGSFGGGGHCRAAGCTIHNITLEEAEKQIIKKAEAALNERNC